MTKSVNHLLKGDRRAALASFGSVMRATKEKANAAMAQAKTRIKEATMGATGGNESDDFSSDDKTAADLAFLFAERELLMEPERSDVVERRAVSTERGAGRGGSGSSSTGATDVDRAALFASGGPRWWVPGRWVRRRRDLRGSGRRGRRRSRRALRALRDGRVPVRDVPRRPQG